MVSFLHAADLHLGLRLTRFPEHVVKKLQDARFQAIERILEEARGRHVDFLLIAGDLFDDHTIDLRLARRAFEILSSSPAPVYVISGNHDPLIPGGLWDREPWITADSGTVRFLRERKPLEVQPGVVLFPCPVMCKTSLEDPTGWIPGDEVDQDCIRIGLAHGSFHCRPGLPENDHLIAENAPQSRKLDYLALGHWHSRQIFMDHAGATRVAYPGVHEPMRYQASEEIRTGWTPYVEDTQRLEFRDDGRGEILHVTIDAPGAPPHVEAIEVGRLRWEQHLRELRSEDDLSRLINEVAMDPARELRVLRLKVSGRLSATAFARLQELRDLLEARYAYGELVESDLQLAAEERELQTIAGHGVTSRVFSRLREESRDANQDVRRSAEVALAALYDIATEAKA